MHNSFILRFRNSMLVLGLLFMAVLYAHCGIPTQEKVRSELRIDSMSYLFDVGEKLTTRDLENKKFTTSQGKLPIKGLFKGAMWVKLKLIVDNGDAPILEIKNPLLDAGELFEWKYERWKSLGEVGDQVHSRKYQGRFFYFPIYKSGWYLLKVTSLGEELYVPLSLQDTTTINERNMHEQFILGGYFGVMLFVILSNLFVLFLLREKTNLYYFGYLLGITLMVCAIIGYGNMYLWHNVPYLANISTPFLASISSYFAILFGQSILKVRRYLPSSNRFLRVLAITCVLNALLVLIPNTYCFRIAVAIVSPLSIVVAFTLIYVGARSYINGYKPARFFLLGFLLFTVFIFIFILRNFGFLGSSLIAEYSLAVGSLLEITCLSFALIDTFGLHKEKTVRTLKVINKLQIEQNINLEKGVQERTLQIQEKNRLIELKTKEIVDSINYAKIIQQGMMQSERDFTSHFCDSFVFFKPKDIVSGDFFWLSETELENGKNHVLCLADCTGHGVPGAILSVLGMRILNDVVRKNNGLSVCEILDSLNNEFCAVFGSEQGKESVNQGMDAVILSVNFEKLSLQFSGAKSDLFIVRNGTLMVLKGDRRSIGQLSLNSDWNEDSNFSCQEFSLEKGDCIYLTTDGYADQFGGVNNKKLKFRFFREYLSKNYHLPMSEQRIGLETYLHNWIGESNEQTDDISVIGFRI